MLPSIPPQIHQGISHPHMLPLLQQAWLSRAMTTTSNALHFTHSPFSAFSSQDLPFPLPRPFLPPHSSPSHSPNLISPRRPDEAEDLSSKRPRLSSEAICPICNISMRWEDLQEHYKTELQCLDNIRTLSPITRPTSSTSSRPMSTSPLKSSSISPTSPFRIESRWQKFERIRNKRRERIGAKLQRRAAIDNRQLPEEPRVGEDQEQELDIGDSLSDCGSGSDGEVSQTFGPLQFTEADVLRCISEGNKDNNDSIDSLEKADIKREGGMSCPSCHGEMSRPVLNVSCWHLKCETCWLKAVGTSKACGICSGNASVKELRRVHV